MRFLFSDIYFTILFFAEKVIGLHMQISLNMTFEDEYNDTTSKMFIDNKKKMSTDVSIKLLSIKPLFFFPNEYHFFFKFMDRNMTKGRALFDNRLFI